VAHEELGASMLKPHHEELGESSETVVGDLSALTNADEVLGASVLKRPP
ncbi:hypothetical protein Tco_1086240, partial [Tanacetum coccineum]